MDQNISRHSLGGLVRVFFITLTICAHYFDSLSSF